MKNTFIRNNLLIIFLAITYCSCNQIKEVKTEVQLDINKRNLNGAFGGNDETENAYFGIYEDSIFYPESNKWVEFKLDNDTIIMIDNEHYVSKLLILKLTKDSLILDDLEYNTELHLNRRK